MVKLFVLLALFSAVAVYPVRAASAGMGQPIIHTDKTHFATGEAVFFWIGVKTTDNVPIPKDEWSTCQLLITRPDGTQNTVKIGWPIDGFGTHGPGDGGWEGGVGLGEKAQPGHYLAIFEFAGQKTEPLTLAVDDVPLLRKIRADFVFGHPTTGRGGSDIAATLTVRNDTDQTLRFPHRDGMNALVSVSLRKVDGSYSNDGFYPPKLLLDQDEPELPGAGFTSFSWEDARKFATITLKPGGVYQQRLSLRAFITQENKGVARGAGSLVPPGHYRVAFTTTLQVLIGDQGGNYADISPVHIPVFSTTEREIRP